VNLDDPATTLALLKLNAVVGVTGFFDTNGSIRSGSRDVGVRGPDGQRSCIDRPAGSSM
jgi:hypothetical protein